MYIREKLNEIMNNSLNSISDICIAKAISEFPRNEPSKIKLNAISILSNVSKSKIVKFCQKLGFTGFIDFRNQLLNQDSKYYKNAIFEQKSDSMLIDEFFDKTIKEIQSFRKYLNEFAYINSFLNLKKRIVILSSAESQNVAARFRDLLLILDYNVIAPNNRIKDYYILNYRHDDFIFLIGSGSIGNELVNFFQEIKSKEINHFLILTESQRTKFSKKSHGIVVEYNEIKSWYHSREINFHFLIESIFYFLSHQKQKDYQKLY